VGHYFLSNLHNCVRVPCQSELSLMCCVHYSQNWGHRWCQNKKAADSRMSPLLHLQIERGCAVHVCLRNRTTHWTCGVSWRIVSARSCPRFRCLYVCTHTHAHTHTHAPSGLSVCFCYTDNITLPLIWWQITLMLHDKSAECVSKWKHELQLDCLYCHWSVLWGCMPVGYVDSGAVHKNTI
jgi:hypothetical protein